MNRNRLVSIGALALIVLFAILIMKPGASSKKKKSVSSKNIVQFEKEGVLWLIQENDTIETLDIEFAKSTYEITKGLMDRPTMETTQGMLFIFPTMEPRSFWMKNTQISLDIIYIKDDLTVESIQKNANPYSEKSLPSDGEAQYVLEVVGGFSDQYNIGPGTKIAYQAL